MTQDELGLFDAVCPLQHEVHDMRYLMQSTHTQKEAKLHPLPNSLLCGGTEGGNVLLKCVRHTVPSKVSGAALTQPQASQCIPHEFQTVLHIHGGARSALLGRRDDISIMDLLACRQAGPVL